LDSGAPISFAHGVNQVPSFFTLQEQQVTRSARFYSVSSVFFDSLRSSLKGHLRLSISLRSVVVSSFCSTWNKGRGVSHEARHEVYSQSLEGLSAVNKRWSKGKSGVFLTEIGADRNARGRGVSPSGPKAHARTRRHHKPIHPAEALGGGGSVVETAVVCSPGAARECRKMNANRKAHGRGGSPSGPKNQARSAVSPNTNLTRRHNATKFIHNG
jgi:hypothetical protein